MSKAIFFLADGFEEIEFAAPWDILKRGGVDVLTVSISERREVISARGLCVLADRIWSDAWGSADLIVLPGGGDGTAHLRAHVGVLDAVRKQIQAGKYVAAICAAPTVLADAGVLKDGLATCYPSVADQLSFAGTQVRDETVVRWNQIVTSKGPGTAAEFGFTLLELLTNSAQAEQVRAQMLFAP